MKSITRNIGKNIIKISIIVFVVMLTTPMKSRAEQTITSKYYEIDKQKGIISRIEPETTIEEFKSKINEEIKIYEDKNCTKEIKADNIGTGKYVKNGENIYETSVVGDFDGDGKATQEELTHIINHIVGLQGANLEGIYYESGDITGDKQVDQRDLTKLIEYLINGELDLGKKEVKAPEIEISVTEKTTKTIIVEVTAEDKEYGEVTNVTYTYWIKKANEEDSKYEKKQITTDKTFTFKDLEANEEYTIKVEVLDKAGNKREKTINATTEPMPDIETEEGVLTFNPIIWENEKASTTISTNTQFKIEYQINSTAGTWIQATQPGENIKIENLKHNDKIYARLTDGINTTKIAIVRIEDKTAPELELKVTQETTKTIIVEVEAQDKESGIDTNATYKFYIKKANEPDSSYLQKQDITSKTCTFTGLKANETYTIKVEVSDKAGNKGEKTINVTTEPMPDIETEEGVLTFNPIKWENEKASTTISTNTQFKIEYQINSTEGTWTQATQPGESIKIENLKHNDKIYARLTDGTNITKTAIVRIEDKIAPELELKVIQETTKTIKIEYTAQDKESGIDPNTYTIWIKKANEEDTNYQEKQNITEKNCTFTELKSNQEYTIKIEITDKAGNKTEKTITAKTKEMETAIGAYCTPTNWTNGEVEVTLPKKEGFTTRYTLDGMLPTTTSEEYNIPFIVSTNCQITYIYTDGTNIGGAGTANITNIDKQQPIINTELVTSNITENGFTISVDVTDSDSGLGKIIWYHKKSNEDTYISSEEIYTDLNGNTEGTTSAVTKTKTYDDLTSGETYNIYAEVYDVAGNKVRIPKEGTIEETVKKIERQVTLSANSGTYTSGADTFTITNNISGGTLTVTSSNTNIATATISGNTVIVTPGTTEGTATITVTSAATGIYDQATAEYTAIVGHHFASKTTTADYLASAADCTHEETYYYKCTRCSEKGTETYTNGSSLGHSSTTGGSLKTAATCTSAAVYYHKCSRCGVNLSTTYTSGNALGHSSTTGGSLKTAATCTSAAVYYHKCSRCGVNLSTTYTSGSELGHSSTTGGTLKTAATCTSPEVYYHKCSRCGVDLSTTYTSGSELGHLSTTGGTLKTAATCTSAAVYYHKCSRCGVDLSTTYTSGSALGHNYETSYIRWSGNSFTSSTHDDTNHVTTFIYNHSTEDLTDVVSFYLYNNAQNYTNSSYAWQLKGGSSGKWYEGGAWTTSGLNWALKNDSGNTYLSGTAGYQSQYQKTDNTLARFYLNVNGYGVSPFGLNISFNLPDVRKHKCTRCSSEYYDYNG